MPQSWDVGYSGAEGRVESLSPAQVRTLKNLLDRLPRFHQHKGRRRALAGYIEWL